MSQDLTDITSRDDLVNFLEIFYSRAQADPVIGEKFAHLDMSNHIQTIADFWHTVLFGSQTYQGDPFGKHLSLKLQRAHFDRWLTLFTSTIDEMFAGPIANEAKHRAGTIAKVFQYKLGLYD